MQDEVNIYIVSELVVGGELFELIQDHGQIEERIAAMIVKQLLLALNYMHK